MPCLFLIRTIPTSENLREKTLVWSQEFGASHSRDDRLLEDAAKLAFLAWVISDKSCEFHDLIATETSVSEETFDRFWTVELVAKQIVESNSRSVNIQAADVNKLTRSNPDSFPARELRKLDQQRRRRRQWLPKLSLRALLVSICIIAIGMAWYTRWYEKEKRVIDSVQTLKSEGWGFEYPVNAKPSWLQLVVFGNNASVGPLNAWRENSDEHLLTEQEEFEFLKHLTSLESLRVRVYEGMDCSPLSKLVNLKQFHSECPAFHDLSWMKSLANLEEVYINRSGV